MTINSIDWNFASSFPSSCDWLLKRLKTFGRFITQKLQRKRIFLEGDSSITNSLCLILAQVLCSHCSHQQHTMDSSETAFWQVTHMSNFMDLANYWFIRWVSGVPCSLCRHHFNLVPPFHFHHGTTAFLLRLRKYARQEEGSKHATSPDHVTI